MRLHLFPALLGLAVAVTVTASLALAQADDGTPTSDNSSAVDSPAAAADDTTPPISVDIAPPATDQSTVAPIPALFVQLVDPADLDVLVPLTTDQLTVHGLTLPGAVVSIDGDLVDIDDQGNFVGVTPLDEGVNDIEVVASDAQGNQTSTILYVVRGE
jgi:hypothetical protein